MFLKITVRIFLVIVSSIITLIAAELIFSKFHPTKQFYQDFVYPERDTHSETVNKQGFRVESEGIIYSQDKGDNFRIICLGDSFTLGYGVADNKTYPVFLEKYLKNNFQKMVQVINVGHAGSTMPGQLDFYKETCLQLEHDLVVLLFSLGDVNDLAREILFKYPERRKEGYDLCILDRYLMNKSKVYTLIAHTLLNHRENAVVKYHDNNIEALTDKYVEYLNSLNTIVKSKNAALILVTYDNSIKEENMIKIFCENEHILFVNISKEYFQRAEEGDINLTFHHNERGNEFLGKIIADKLISKGIIPINDIR